MDILAIINQVNTMNELDQIRLKVMQEINARDSIKEIIEIQEAFSKKKNQLRYRKGK